MLIGTNKITVKAGIFSHRSWRKGYNPETINPMRVIGANTMVSG